MNLVSSIVLPSAPLNPNQFAAIAPPEEDLEILNCTPCEPSQLALTTSCQQLDPGDPCTVLNATTINTNVRKSGRNREVVGKPDYNEIDSADDVVVDNSNREKARLRQQQCRAK
eukprot:gene5903-33474_t